MIARLLLTELRRRPRTFATVILILMIGYLGPVLITAIRSSTDDYLAVRSKQMLGSDVSVSATREIKDDEERVLYETFEPRDVASEIEMVSMVSGPGGSALVEIRGVDEKFPLYGEMEFADGFAATGSARELQAAPNAWAYPEALLQIGVKVGDTIRIGKTDIRVRELKEDPGLSRFGGFAPRIFIGRRFIAETGLTGFGSQVMHRRHFRLGDNAADVNERVAAAKERLKDSDLYYRTPQDAIWSLKRFLDVVSRYLAVLTLIVFGLAWMSAFYILQVFIQERLRAGAILMTLGASRLRVQVLYGSQIILVSVLALALAVAAAWLSSVVVMRMDTLGLPAGFHLSLHIRDVLQMLAVAVVSALIFTLPLLVKIRRLRPQRLLNESATGISRADRSTPWLSYGPMLLIFTWLATWLTGSVLWAAALILALMGAALAIWALGQRIFVLLNRTLGRRSRPSRLVFLSLARGRFGMRLCFLAVAFTALVLNVIPHLLASVLEETGVSAGGRRPDLFLFNIPDESLENLKAFVSERNGRLEYLSPMVLGRLRSVNDKPPTDDWSTRFPTRMTYRAEFAPSETMIEGEKFRGVFDPAAAANGSGPKYPGISLETRYAERNGYKIGDVLTFDVLGLPVSGQVVNLRRVRWTDFHPNFFIEFQPGILDDAPKTWIANVHLPPEAVAGTTSASQTELVRRFPELSVVDVGRALERMTVLLNAMRTPVQAVAWAAVAVSFLLLIAVIRHSLRLRGQEIDILQVFGADGRRVQFLILQEYLWLGVTAAASGAGLGVAVSFFVTRQIFSIRAGFDATALFTSNVVILLLMAAVAWLSGGRALRLKATSTGG